MPVVYNVKRRFFDMKNDAEAYRKEHGGETIKLVINDRKELMFLLNGIMGIEEPPAEEPRPAPEAKIASDESDCVPEFLRTAWQKFHERTKGQ